MNYEKWEKVFFLAIFLSDEVDIITLKCYTYGAVYCSLAELENDLQHCRQCWTMPVVILQHSFRIGLSREKVALSMWTMPLEVLLQ